MNLPSKENIVITHYGCSSFEKNEHVVYWLGALLIEYGEKKYFYAGDECSEEEKILKYSKFIAENKDKTFIHWSMNSIKFGFRAIEMRFNELTGAEIDCTPNSILDLSEYLKDKYGTAYIEKSNGRLNNLARLNGFTGVKNQVEVKKLNEASDRLELLYSIVEFEISGTLKVLGVNEDSSRLNNDEIISFFEKYDLHNLEKVSQLKSIQELYDKIRLSTPPNVIALFFELGIIDHLNSTLRTKKQTHKELGVLLGVSERRIRGNINILTPGSAEDKSAYTSYTHIKEVRDYLSK